MSTHRTLKARVAALESWANTVDRAERTARARQAGPGDVSYWMARLDPERFANATWQQRVDAATALQRAHYAALALKSAQARAKRPAGEQTGGDAS